MLENLLKTWRTLSPAEMPFSKKELDDFCSRLKSKPCKHEDYDLMQGYLQRCIEARNEWDWQLTSGGFPKPDFLVFDAVVFLDGSRFKASSETALVALLTAYLTALAAQRAIASGTWQHANGDKYQAKAIASWLQPGTKDQPNSYLLEENPSESIWLVPRPDREGEWVYLAEKDYGDRVFYQGESGNWAGPIDSFLGLKDGQLRFAKK